jgi:4-hydroxy-4-methyl-2-oxoglutarate aldolase
MNISSLAERLAEFDTATLHESGASATMDVGMRMLSGDARLAGPAVTAICPPANNFMIHEAVAQATAGTVLVAQCHDANFGVWGEILTVAAQSRGVVGLVLDGSVRDLGAIRALGFPVFARGTCLRGTGKAAEGSVGQPISCGGTLVRSGDLIVADESGIVVIQPEDAEAILARAERRSRREAAMIRELRGGRTTMELLGLRKEA